VPDWLVNFLMIYVGAEVVKFVLGRLMKRSTIGTEYITATHCKECKKDRDDKLVRIGNSLDDLRSVLLIVAVKVGADNDTLERLARKGGS